MFSYEIRIRRITNPNIKIKAVASLIVDGVMSIEGFKIINGSKGLFVSVPNHKGTIMEDGVKVDKYFDDVLNNWTTNIVAGDILRFDVISVNQIRRLLISLKLKL